MNKVLRIEAKKKHLCKNLPFLVLAPIFNRHGQLMRVEVFLETCDGDWG